MKYVRIHVRGRVQGVGFRFFTQQLAMEHHVFGWVRNEDDGSVLIEATADDQDMKNFITQIKQGPSRFAKVQEADVTKLKGDPGFTSFGIKG
ncbi:MULTISPECIES: acylphosphatase [Gracilibacillus]|uniref:acylphosphatase n=1 Tax=Gracilibacillus TaxID=74385 RepID=UPI0008268137|nr:MULTISPECIES: acylphosphatase [Gracilibacillus]